MWSPTAAILLMRTDRTGYLQVIPRGIIISKDNACHYSSINHPDAARQLAYPQCQFAARSCESAAAGCLMPPSLRGRTEGTKSSSCPAARYGLTAVTRRWGCAASELERVIFFPLGRRQLFSIHPWAQAACQNSFSEMDESLPF